MLIDRVPELPYFLLIAYYYLSTPYDRFLHVISFSYIFLMSSILLGFAIKAALKTTRPVRYSGFRLARYDVPSLHTMVSMGAVMFAYFIEPMYCIILVPIGVLYMVSRVRLRVHTKTAVVIGALIGLVLGSIVGAISQRIILGEIKTILVMLLFITPVFASFYRIRYLKKHHLFE